MTWLNRLIYIAVDREILRFNPITDVPYEKKEAPKLNHISRSQLQLIMERPMPNKWQELTRRVFIFSAFTSLAYVDMKELYPHHIGKTAEGRRYIRINRKKPELNPLYHFIRLPSRYWNFIIPRMIRNRYFLFLIGICSGMPLMR